MKAITEQDLKKILKTMFWYAGEEMPDNFNFKKPNWFHKYSWTERDEERFVNWLAGFFSGYCSKKLSIKLAKEFVGEYGWKIKPLKIKDFTPLIPDEQCKAMMSAKQYKRFIKWMFCQTRSPWGYYRWDVERFLNGDKSWD